MRVSDLTRPKPVAASIDLGDGDVVNVIFDRNKVTPRWIEESQQRVENSEAQATSQMLADVILEWDVTEDDDSPYAITPDNIMRLSLGVQALLFRHIFRSAMPADAEGKALSGPPSMLSSGSTAPAAGSPNGQEISPSPAVSASQSLT